jgi:hypothetical protein
VAPPESDGATEIDYILQSWRQGDCVVGDDWFTFRFNPASPLTSAAVEATGSGGDLADVLVRGFAVITQTCDIVRRSAQRSFVEVCPLVEVSEAELGKIARCYLPQYLLVPGVADQRLVVDLDRSMTVEKGLAGC